MEYLNRRALVATALLWCIGTSLMSDLMKKPNAFDNSDDDIYRRQLSIALENGGCQVTRAHMAPVDIPPTWQASFPGSGSRMAWSLVEA